MENNDETKPLEEVNTENMVDSEDELKKKKKKSEKLIFLVGFTAVIFMVATYAWFIGTSRVWVNPFHIKISSSEGLTISLDAIHFSQDVTVTEDIVGPGFTDYSTNKNHWVNTESIASGGSDETGLVPISSVGEMDTEYSVLKLFSKSSITSISGGYRLVSDRIENYDTDDDAEPSKFPAEKDGYVVFDLFLKNSSGGNYIKTFNSADDEAIYMLKSSYVKLYKFDEEHSSGADGLENSARLAFMEIGRTDANNIATDNNAQRLTCSSTDGSGTVGDLGLCNLYDNNMGDRANDGRGYTWNIWEPNDALHTADSVAHFSRICQKRLDIYTYNDNCDTFKDLSDITYHDPEDYVPTYAVREPITSLDNINIYDGLNDYGPADANGYKIKKMSYFTDTVKRKIYANTSTEEQREPFLYLAPNSVTKIRVYIWLEGQDVDNYDIANTNMGLEIFFGFTKDQYEDANLDTEYTITVDNIGSGDATIEGNNLPYSFTGLTYGSTQELNVVPSSGNRFVGWEDGNTENPRSVVVSTSDSDGEFGGIATSEFTYNAIVIPEASKYVFVKSNNEDWGTVTGGGEYTGSPLELTAIPNSGGDFEFVKWSDGDTNETRSYTPTTDVHLTAIFKAGKPVVGAGVFTGQSAFGSVTVDGYDSHTEPYSPGTTTYTGLETEYEGTRVIRAQAAAGYRFSCWVGSSGTCEHYSPTRAVVGVRRNTFMWAQFVKTFDVTVSIDSANKGRIDVVTNEVPAQTFSQKKTGFTFAVEDGSDVTLTASPESGYVFSHWNDDTSDTALEKTVTVSAATTITAHFVAE